MVRPYVFVYPTPEKYKTLPTPVNRWIHTVKVKKAINTLKYKLKLINKGDWSETNLRLLQN